MSSFDPDKNLPGCMMPDGGECCESYAALYADWKRLRALSSSEAPVAWAVFAENGNVRLWSTKPNVAKAFVDSHDNLKLTPLYPTPSPDTRVREALTETRDVLSALKKAVEASNKMNGREYIDLGIQVNNALGHAFEALAALPQQEAVEPTIGKYRADYSHLTDDEIAKEDPKLTELYARSHPALDPATVDVCAKVCDRWIASKNLHEHLAATDIAVEIRALTGKDGA